MKREEAQGYLNKLYNVHWGNPEYRQALAIAIAEMNARRDGETLWVGSDEYEVFKSDVGQRLDILRGRISILEGK